VIPEKDPEQENTYYISGEEVEEEEEPGWEIIRIIREVFWF